MRIIVKISLSALFLMVSMGIWAQDIEIRDFKKNITSLMGSVNPIYDNTGQACAVIRLSVRDTTFVVESNMGVKRRVSQLGEIVVYVPATTKRLTIRHEGLLPLRYDIPVKLEPKKTYDALLIAVKDSSPALEIPVISKEKETPETPVTDHKTEQGIEEEKEVEALPTLVSPVVKTASKPEKKQKEKKVKSDSSRKTFATIGVGFQLMSILGPSLSFGIDANHHLVELGATIGINSSDKLYFYNKKEEFIVARQYTPYRVQLRYGYEINPSKGIGITPIIGGAMNIFSSKSGEEVRSSYLNHYLKASSFSLTPSVRFSFQAGKRVKIHITPEFAIGLYKSDNCKVISDYNSKFKSWTDGFQVNLGVNFLL